MSEIVYEVWGEDTFASETFQVGSYSDRKAAYNKVKELEESAMTQCESLRDTYWVVEATPEYVAERRERETERRLELNRMSYFSSDRLEDLMKCLFKQLAGVMKMDEKGLCQEDIISIEERNVNDNDCYDSVSFRYYRRLKESDQRNIRLEINFKKDGSSSISCLSGTLQEIKRLISLKSGRDSVLKVFDERVHDFYYNR